MAPSVIECTSLSKSYGHARGIEDVNLKVGEGEIFGFIGPNGAGKSTTIRILLNLIFPTGGSASIFGMDVVRQTKEIKRTVGYVPSDANAYSAMGVREFLAYCGRFYGTAGHGARLEELAGYFELDLDRKITDLSIGNRKKVSIVQSLLHNPKLLILDEPTMGLDPLMQSKFFDLLREENQRGVTIFFSSHILNEVQKLCKRVAIIKEGRILRVEDIDTLRRKQLKKIRIAFEDPADVKNFTVPGMVDTLSNAGLLEFMFSGDIGELIAHLANRKPADLTIEEPSLEEIFMHYYN